MKPILEIVTVTGADDSICPEELIPIAKEFPFVEFGILLSQKQRGYKRFPSREWLDKLYVLWQKEKIALSGHLCGKWVRDLCIGIPSFFDELGYTWKMFERFQLNFHGERHLFNVGFSAVLERFLSKKQVIFQMDGMNDTIYSVVDGNYFTGKKCFSARPLFDASGGAGMLPKEWPAQEKGKYCGYAGGLSPDNVQKELEKISQVATGPIWIDAETLLRSENDRIFDLKKVRRFLEVTRPWVINA